MIALPFILNSLLNFVIGIFIAKFLGPEEYGQYALAMAIGVVLQTFALDWVRMSATRYYSEHERVDHPEIRATLDAATATIACVSIVAALALLVAAPVLPASTSLLAFAIIVSVGNGLFDVSTALVRARFLDRTYIRLVVSKSILSVVLTVGGCWYFASARVALIGVTLSMIGSLLLNRRALADHLARPGLADQVLVRRFAVYALPIVTANVLYQLIPAGNRALLSEMHGFAAAGELAFAFEIGIRMIGAVGSAVDVILFQLAVDTEKTSGLDAARAMMSRNMAMVLAILLPMTIGLWLVLPSFEQLIVPEEFRGSFPTYFTLVLPAILCFGIANFCVGPAFQILHKTKPLLVGGAVAVLADIVALGVLPIARDAATFAFAQSLASAVGLGVLVFWITRLEKLAPTVRDLAGILGGSGLMFVLVTPLRGLPPGLTTLALQVALGAIVYALVVWFADVVAVRSQLTPILKAWWRARCAGPARSRSPKPASDGYAR